LLLLLVFSFQVYSKVFYQHSHILPDGSLVTHAHPFNKGNDNSPVKNHTHTSYEYYIIDNANLLFSVSILSIFLIYAGNKARITIRKTPDKKLYLQITTPGRDPPVA
jgi:hypothetical protein